VIPLPPVAPWPPRANRYADVLNVGSVPHGQVVHYFPIPCALVLGSLVIGVLIAWRRAQSLPDDPVDAKKPNMGFWQWFMGPQIRSQTGISFWICAVGFVGGVLAFLAWTTFLMIAGIATGHLFPFS
jgi:hypothetical protein